MNLITHSTLGQLFGEGGIFGPLQIILFLVMLVLVGLFFYIRKKNQNQ
jgi:hypothetical protein